MTALRGTYRARAVSGGLGYAGNGTEQLGVDFVITEGPSEGQHVTWWGYFSEKAITRTVESLRTMGWQGDDLCDLTGIDQNLVDLVIEPEEYEDKRTGEIRTKSKVQWINKPSGLSIKDAMSAGQAREFASRMRSKIMTLPGAIRYPALPHKAPAAPPSKPAVDDDIPF